MAGNRNRPIVYMGWDGLPHNYLERILRYLEQTTLKSGGHIKVSHDDWCAVFKGGGCNCNPDVREMLPWEIPGS